LIQLNGIENPRLIQPGQKIQVPLPHTTPQDKETMIGWDGFEYGPNAVASGNRCQAELNQAVTAHKNDNTEVQSKPSPSFTAYTIQKGDTLWDLATTRFQIPVEELIQLNGIENPRLIQPGQKIQVPLPNTTPRDEVVVASWYGPKYHGKTMANGETFDMFAATIAHKDLPLGTRVELENPDTGIRAKATVTDRGPYIEGRDVDLSYGLARKLALVEKGVGKLRMRVLG
ncbi:septal ring lytic transglycosylase RlpA family protein, partial [candidate division KSB3 bacterium]|nr:septal ring lytic transglycosylase RlpA family protein [candidate division KSB3 bacterium]